ncbi:homeobox protein 14 [Harpegnathos saltator]|uniref:Uncharacterized protein n=1 Tax=Harpegnathos saltator TaxID=610380 RepID=E2B489_HARSA|nr:homeobox protein 14 [Harpegnathos saltator]EFN89506.1 hypothetical protein EAI_01738 [Harpegnathos saltator]
MTTRTATATATLKSGDKKHFPASSPTSQTSRNTDAIRSASSPQLTTTKAPRSKVYRKASLKTPFACELNGSGDGSDISEKNSVIRYTNAAAEKKQKRRSGGGGGGGGPSEKESDAKSDKWNPEDIHITCNPLSTPYPYSTPATTTTTTATTTTTTTTTTVESDEEPKSRSCGSFLPILALIPQSVISFQYLSPKMKFSWWRNKIS